MKKYLLGIVTAAIVLFAWSAFSGNGQIYNMVYDASKDIIHVFTHGSNSVEIDTQPEFLLQVCGGNTAIDTTADEVVFDNVTYIKKGSYNISTGRYVIPWDGWYKVTFALTSDGANNTQGNYGVSIRKNGTPTNYVHTDYQGVTGLSGRIGGSQLFQANKDEYISLWATMTEAETLYDNCAGSYMYVEALR